MTFTHLVHEHSIIFTRYLHTRIIYVMVHVIRNLILLVISLQGTVINKELQYYHHKKIYLILIRFPHILVRKNKITNIICIYNLYINLIS